jgi:hypothetical protein
MIYKDCTFQKERAMKKVLIVDDDFVHFCRTLDDKNDYDDEYYRSEVPAYIRRELDIQYNAWNLYLERTANPEYYDLTNLYHEAGGCEDVQLLVLGYPTLSSSFGFLESMDYFHASWLAQKMFDMGKVLANIEKIDPDVLIVDMGFWAPVAADVLEEYVLQRKRKEINQFTIRPLCRNPQLNFPESVVYTFETALVLGKRQGSLSSRGGVLLARELKRLERPFSFWTGDLHHGGDGLIHAYTLGLLSEQDVREVIASDDEIWDLECGYRQELLPAHNCSGSVLVGCKSVFGHDWPHRKSGDRVRGFNPKQIPYLQRIFEIAEKYQSK